MQPLSVPPLGLVPIESVTWVELSLPTTLLFASSTDTIAWVGKTVPPVTDPPGCCVKTTFVAGPKIATLAAGLARVVSATVLIENPLPA